MLLFLNVKFISLFLRFYISGLGPNLFNILSSAIQSTIDWFLANLIDNNFCKKLGKY